MKALIYDGPEVLRYGDASDPVAADGDHLIRIEAVGICGSDMHAYLGHDARRPAPLILGHEAAGVILGGQKSGARVTINPLVTCGTCEACASGRTNLCPSREIISMPPREGGFAQFVTMPAGNLVEVPEHVTFAQASLVEPIACGWHTARLCRRAFPRGRTALVIGGGAIGLGAALSLVAQGVMNVKILEPNRLRAAYLRDACGQVVIAPDDLPDGGTFDIVIDGVGYEATRATASAQVKAGGVIGHIGLGDDMGGLDVRRMTLQEITFIGTYTYTAQDFRDTAAAMFDGRLGDLGWTEQRPLSAGAQAFADIRAGVVAAPKIVLMPQDG
ncbi:alcohol dehydrogenase catalytic domain-containing protein [Octadecabacter sp. G9-8]|uniref:Alcohol dehydrogenase catalytic domain-containing protein n=1 Tax=Octadecabacter dasysiphoniae TaxID=2909341 RepID=A0ABS9CSC3_9RHOB|nr:alcohol dehydrogenase catalytic domain-containing protein [Octadecabacter dasysiphoniae]MCF2870143.1 alcohol dehydrogenase catalytic domain-containing protein [Octadecabacter dasysiphoniae]